MRAHVCFVSVCVNVQNEAIREGKEHITAKGIVYVTGNWIYWVHEHSCYAIIG